MASDGVSPPTWPGSKTPWAKEIRAKRTKQMTRTKRTKQIKQELSLIHISEPTRPY